MDVLSDVLSTVRLQGAIHSCPELSAPWGVAIPAQPDRAPFYVLSRGSCYLEVDGDSEGAGGPQRGPGPVPGREADGYPRSGGRAVPLAGGDVVMLPHGDPHTLRDRLQTPVIPLDRLLREDSQGTVPRALRHGGGGAKSALVSGFFQFEGHAAAQLVAPLPTLIHIPAEAGQSVPWLEATLKFLAAESTSAAPGAQLVMARLTDVLFVQIVRAYIMQADPQGEACQRQAGILRALVDPQIAQALGLMHQQLDHPWTVAELAQRVNMSRTGFAVRFAKLAGITPLDYLRKWRMQKASDLLRQGEENLEQIARRVGYGSGAAFSKTFKADLGLSPGLYRKEQGGAVDESRYRRGSDRP